MRKILVFWATVLATINPTGISPFAAVHAVAAQANTLGNNLVTQVSTVPVKLKLDITTLRPVKSVAVKPDFEAQYSRPLIEAAKAKAQAEAEKARQAQLASTRIVVKPIVIVTGDVWSALRFCEAGGNYRTNTGNGYFGAYQFDIGTWANYGGYVRPDLAPPAVQDAKAKDTQARRGWYPWPACAARLGLI